ncbi:Uncharacterized protein PBTT_01711 [Plasmodiophora brassicae]|uniref:DUF7918 domain-containing protein n=1 Tax=Plasmodiophora brassicae TaxID=37360 RepID=A0A0G4ITC3_PLABS|nr:hypothetical protein PBRA_006460 [Plasmodiophora brassicae]SPQ94431.1 unnamed protein product [Plasmodiophora brassicae]
MVLYVIAVQVRWSAVPATAAAFPGMRVKVGVDDVEVQVGIEGVGIAPELRPETTTERGGRLKVASCYIESFVGRKFWIALTVHGPHLSEQVARRAQITVDGVQVTGVLSRSNAPQSRNGNLISADKLQPFMFTAPVIEERDDDDGSGPSGAWGHIRIKFIRCAVLSFDDEGRGQLVSSKAGTEKQLKHNGCVVGFDGIQKADRPQSFARTRDAEDGHYLEFVFRYNTRYGLELKGILPKQNEEADELAGPVKKEAMIAIDGVLLDALSKSVIVTFLRRRIGATHLPAYYNYLTVGRLRERVRDLLNDHLQEGAYDTSIKAYNFPCKRDQQPEGRDQAAGAKRAKKEPPAWNGAVIDLTDD